MSEPDLLLMNLFRYFCANAQTAMLVQKMLGAVPRTDNDG